jgi:hypothetical protein
MRQRGDVQKAVGRVQAAQRALRNARPRLAQVTELRDVRACYHSRSWAWVSRGFEARKAWLLRHPDVVGCGPCISAYVRRKVPARRLQHGRKLPRYVRVGKRRLAIDVVEGGRYEGQALNSEELGTRTARGTLGAFAGP